MGNCFSGDSVAPHSRYAIIETQSFVNRKLPASRCKLSSLYKPVIRCKPESLCKPVNLDDLYECEYERIIDSEHIELV